MFTEHKCVLESLVVHKTEGMDLYTHLFLDFSKSIPNQYPITVKSDLLTKYCIKKWFTPIPNFCVNFL